jgi:hypothetical protein
MAVNGLIRQAVRLGVHSAVDVGNSIGLKFLQHIHRLPPKGLEVRTFHLVAAVYLLD